jgi:hypothetical protein
MFNHTFLNETVDVIKLLIENLVFKYLENRIDAPNRCTSYKVFIKHSLSKSLVRQFALPHCPNEYLDIGQARYNRHKDTTYREIGF